METNSNNYKPSSNPEYDTYEMNYVSTGRGDDLEATFNTDEISSRDARSVEITNTKNANDTNKMLNTDGRVQNGNMKCCLYFREDPIIAIGPNYFYFIIFSVILFSFHSSIFFFLNLDLNTYIKYIGNSLYFLQIFTYTLVTLKNPGIPSNKNKLLAKNEKPGVYKSFSHCSMCNSYTAIDSCEITFHCPDCDVCIEAYDHHCVWTSKCVGKGNIKLFYSFVVITPCYLLFVLFALLGSFI